tara:strand:+ start:614 stop:1108 length:495 start_codon:yes stop_codon:yes gene_type:complete
MARPSMKIKVPTRQIMEIEKELFKLGDPRWVFGRYQAAAKHAMKPVLEMIRSTIPVDTGTLQKSIILNSKKSRKRRGQSSARVGVGSKKIFIRTDKDGKPQLHLPGAIINAIEFSKSGKKGTGKIREAAKKEGNAKSLEQRIREFINIAVKKRTKFLLKKRSKK